MGFSIEEYEKYLRIVRYMLLHLSDTASACIGWLQLEGSFKLQVSFAAYSLFCRALLQKETYNVKEPTDRSHPMSIYLSIYRYLSISPYRV